MKLCTKKANRPAIHKAMSFAFLKIEANTA